MKQNLESFTDFPISYQKDLYTRIFRILVRGESLLLFAPPGMGKTLTLEMLEKNTKLQQELGNSTNLRFHSFNCENLSEDNQMEIVINNLASEARTNTNSHLVLIFDHVEKLGSGHFTKLLFSIKALRESARERISFLFASDKNLRDSDLEAFGPIKPILAENFVMLGPLSKGDALLFMDKIEKIYGFKLKPEDKKAIYEATGGVPRLMKRLIKLVCDGLEIDATIQNPSLDLKLKLDLEKMADFLAANKEITLSIPLLTALQAVKEETWDQVGDVKFKTRLTRQEYNLAHALISRTGQMCSREEMIKAVWPKNLYETSEHALDQMLHRLRKKLESASPKCNLLTYRGRGCKMEITS